jgi:hypothetical protein
VLKSFTILIKKSFYKILFVTCNILPKCKNTSIQVAFFFSNATISKNTGTQIITIHYLLHVTTTLPTNYLKKSFFVTCNNNIPKEYTSYFFFLFTTCDKTLFIILIHVTTILNIVLINFITIVNILSSDCFNYCQA